MLITTDNVSSAEYKKFKIGITTGRPNESALRLLKDLGFHPQKPDHPRDYNYNRSPVKDIYVDSKGVKYLIEYLPIKPSDVINFVQGELVDAVVCWGDVWYNLENPNYNIKYLAEWRDELGHGHTHISLLKRKDDDPLERFKKDPSKKLKILSEYNDTFRLMQSWLTENQITDPEKCFEIIPIKGGLEGHLLSDIADYGVSIVQSGETVQQNNLEVVKHLRKTYLNLWCNIKKSPVCLDFCLSFKPNLKFLILEGIDGSGKTTQINQLNTMNEFHDYIILDRAKDISRMTLEKAKKWPKQLTDPRFTVIVLDLNPETASERLGPTDEPWESLDYLTYYRLKYMELASHYGLRVINGDQNPAKVTSDIVDSLTPDGATAYLLPKMSEMTVEKFKKFDFVVEGCSKEVRNYDDRFDLIRYKPTIYSHKWQREGTIEGSATERQMTTRNLLYIMAAHGIKHTYVYVGDEFILADKVRFPDPPPVEVCVKKFHVGTHKHIYYDMDSLIDRTTGKKICGDNQEYSGMMVRFDYRNPNHISPTEGQRLIDMNHTQIFVTPLRSKYSEDEIEKILQEMFPNGIPMGDYAMCEDLANRLINTEEAKKLAIKAFTVLSEFMASFGIQFQDVCLMMLCNGQKLFGEVSQDCGRYKYIEEDKLSAMDKDIWRAGGSSELVLEKWKKFSVLVEDASDKVLKDLQKPLFDFFESDKAVDWDGLEYFAKYFKSK